MTKPPYPPAIATLTAEQATACLERRENSYQFTLLVVERDRAQQALLDWLQHNRWLTERANDALREQLAKSPKQKARRK